ncbi:MAG: phenylacetate--CoA ligase [Clostridia bacterium]|nr:phenylacetate--CoA ligase [Clostridia bacterium]
MMIWNEACECMSRQDMEDLQSERLRKLVAYSYDNVTYYRKKMDEAGVKPEDIKSISDLSRLPFTVKDDLRDNYPYDAFAVPMRDIVRIHASSGTTGKPTVVGYTKADLETWAEVMARTFSAAGVREDSIVQVAYGYGLFTGGLGAHYGAEKLGASVIPISGGNTQKQIMLLQDFGSDAIACTPSYALYLAEVLGEMGIDPRKDLKLKYGIFGAEPWSHEMRAQIEEKLGIRATDIYGLSEIIGPGVATECELQDGLHIMEDHFLPEIINPETGEVLKEGQKGELVFTTLTKEGIPLIRYRTRDVTSLRYDKCGCGRTLVRMEKVMGRSDDMLIIRGVNVFPTQVESVLANMAEIEPHYLLVVDRKNNMDTLEIWVEMSEELFSDEVKKIEEVRQKIKDNIQSLLGLTADIKLVEPKTIERSMGKAKRVEDKRKL